MVYSKGPTWRIIPTSKWLITTVCKSLPNGLNGLYMAVTNHLLTGMILQVRMTPRCLQAVTVKDMKNSEKIWHLHLFPLFVLGRLKR